MIPVPVLPVTTPFATTLTAPEVELALMALTPAVTLPAVMDRAPAEVVAAIP
jgi:hypothetical protein